MIITRATEYAVRCVLYLTVHRDRPIIGRREIAHAMNTPEHFLGKIAQRLSRAEIIRKAADGYNRTKLTPTVSRLLERWFRFLR